MEKDWKVVFCRGKQNQPIQIQNKWRKSEGQNVGFHDRKANHTGIAFAFCMLKNASICCPLFNRS